MKYVFRKGYYLRYFKGSELYVLFHDGDEPAGVHPIMGDALKLCDGRTELLPLLTPNTTLLLIDKAAEKNWIRIAEEGETADEDFFREEDIPYVRFLQWSITGFCNAKCRHCGLSAPGRTHKDLPTEKMLSVIKEIADCHIGTVSLTGGEPLLRRDLPTLLEAIHDNNIKIQQIATNGFLLNEKMIELFEKNGLKPEEVQISYDGAGHHDWMRGIPGCEEKVKNAIRLCAEHGWKVTVAMCLHRGNLDSIDETVRIADELGASIIRFNSIYKFNDSVSLEGLEAVPPEELYQFYYDYAPVFLSRKYRIPAMFEGVMTLDSKRAAPLKVIAGTHGIETDDREALSRRYRSQAYISESGEVMPGIVYVQSGEEQKYYTLKEHTLREALTNEALMHARGDVADSMCRCNPDCIGCEYMQYCIESCASSSAIEQPGYFESGLSQCTFYKNGWLEKFRNLEKEINGNGSAQV